MADVATSQAANGKGNKATPATATASTTTSAVVKPERPNEEEYKANLAKAEKELKAAEEKMVCDIFQFAAVRSLFGTAVPHSLGSIAR